MMNPDRSAAHSLNADSLRTMFTRTSPPADRKPLTRRGSSAAEDVRFADMWAACSCSVT